MKLYLYNQTRDRDLDEYKKKLLISTYEFDQINQTKKNILLIGGGISPIQDKWSTIRANITNIDFSPSEIQTDRLHQITGNFLTEDFCINYFDEIWSLYSLPLYAPDTSSIYIFIAKSMLILVPGGKLRIFPLEFGDDKKMKTRDAEWDISTEIVTNTTIEYLSKLKKHEVKTTYTNLGKHDEKTVISVVPKDLKAKHKLNKNLIDTIKQFSRNETITPEIYRTK